MLLRINYQVNAEHSSQEIERRAMRGDDAAESDANKILSTPVSGDCPLLPSTPSKALSKKKTSDWKSLTTAEQMEVLHDVANEHTKLSLDFEGLRYSVVAALKVAALQVKKIVESDK